MDLHRGALARIDPTWLPASVRTDLSKGQGAGRGAKWSTWKRYFDAASISMGRAIMALIDRELPSVFGDSSSGESPVFAQRAEDALATRGAQVAARGGQVEAAERRLRRWSERYDW